MNSIHHGLCLTPEYVAWQNMRARCENPEHKAYRNYGGRGITVCRRWRRFASFVADVGIRPSKDHSIDRKDNNGNYEPGNVRWATKEEQQNNRSTSIFIVFGSRRLTITQWERILGLRKGTLMRRMGRRIPLTAALLTPYGQVFGERPR